MGSHQAAFTDGISRMLGVLGILLAVGGSAFLYQQNRQLKQQVAAIEDTTGTSDTAKKFNQDWNDQLVTALNVFKSRGNEAIEKLTEAEAERDRVLKEKLAMLPDSIDSFDTASVEAIVDRKLGTFDGTLDTAQIEAIVDRRLALRKVVLPEELPELRVAHNVMKPSDDSDANVTVIANDGDQAADIKSITFRPIKNGQFQVDAPLKMGSESEDDWVIRFLAAENQATQAGRHHDYARQLLFGEKTIPANGSVRVRVEIDNSKHVGWGLEGELVLEYGDGRTLTADVKSVFVASDTDST